MRKISFEDRASQPDELQIFNEADQIADFSSLAGECISRFPALYVKSDEGKVVIFDITDASPPKVCYSVSISSSFVVNAFHGTLAIPLRDLVGFSYKLRRWSQLGEIVNRTCAYQPEEVIDSEGMHFIKSQMELIAKAKQARRYPLHVVHTSLQLFLSSRNAYRCLSNVLALPAAATLKKNLGKFSRVGGLEECEATIASVFEELNEGQRNSCLLFDKMYVKPSIRYRGGHLLGYSIDEPAQTAKTILDIMLKPIFGGPAFVCRLLLIHRLQPNLVVEELDSVISAVAKNGGSVMAFVLDNHMTNRTVYKRFHGKHI